jgi:hypothetical protein
MSALVSASSSDEKARVLPSLLAADDIVVVVGFGTAATPGMGSQNGCVVIGTTAYLHDPKVAKTDSRWPCPVPDQLLTSSLGRMFTAITASAGYPTSAEALLIPPPKNAAATLSVNVNADFVSVTEINVTNSADYATADQAVLDAYAASKIANPVGSLETTHGVIRACFPKPADPVPFMFVSGITDRVGQFNNEVLPALYQQNFVAAHNAGVAVAQMLPALMTVLAAR